MPADARHLLALAVGLWATASATPLPAAEGPRGPHPRIWLTPPTLSALKRSAGDPSSRMAAAIQLCGDTIRTPDKFRASGYQGSDWAFPASACALAWRVTGDARYAAAGIKLWRALLEDVETIGDKKACVPGRPAATWNASVRRDDGYAIRFVGTHAALAYDWLHDAPGVDESLRRESRDCFASWIGWYTQSGYLNDVPGSNYHAGFVLAKTLAAIATAGEDPRAERAWSEVTADLFGAQILGRGLAGEEAAGDVPPGPLVGGDWPEGWQYGPLSVVEYALAGRAVEEQGTKLPLLHRWADEVTLRLLYATTPGGDEVYVGSGDTEAERFNLAQDGAGAIATIAGPGSDEAAGWAAVLATRSSKWPGNLVFEALAEARGVAPRRYLEQPRPLWYLARGTRNVYARSDWQSSAFWAVFTSAPRLVPDHQHMDATNFVFSRGHDALVVDPSPYGSRSSLTSNAATCDSNVVQVNYKPSQTPWSRAELSFARGTRGGVVAARGDYARAFRFADTESDIPLARRDWVMLPEGEIVAIDRAETGAPDRRLRLRFRTPAHLTLGKGGKVATGTVGDSALAIHAVVLSGGAPVVRAAPVGDCFAGPVFGACAAARVAVDEYAVEVPGPEPIAVHVIEGLGRAEAPPEVTAVGGTVIGASIRRGKARSLVIGARRAASGPGSTMSYSASGDLPARHVVFDAPEDPLGRSSVRAIASSGRCQVTIVAAPKGVGFPGRPLIFTTQPAAAGCEVAIDPDAPSARIR